MGPGRGNTDLHGPQSTGNGTSLSHVLESDRDPACQHYSKWNIYTFPKIKGNFDGRKVQTIKDF